MRKRRLPFGAHEVLENLDRSEFKKTLRRDVIDLYEFYLDGETRDRLRKMSRLRRWLAILPPLVKAMLRRLSRVRRLLLIIGVIFYFVGDVRFVSGSATLNLNFRFVGFLIPIFILMLELKDKLLARDELEVGRAVQLALLPESSPELDGWDIWLYTRPANDVGGDLVDYLSLGPDRLGLALGDVAGKGLGAALLMAKLQSTLRACATGGPSLTELGASVNRIFCRDSLPGRFATLVYLELPAGRGTVRLLNAGHQPPVVARSGSAPRVLEAVALPLGVSREAAFVEQAVELEEGDLLVIYSDGLTEALNVSGEFFGEERLLGILPGLSGLGAEETGRRLVAEVGRFAGEARPSDDLSLILARRKSGLP